MNTKDALHCFGVCWAHNKLKFLGTHLTHVKLHKRVWNVHLTAKCDFFKCSWLRLLFICPVFKTLKCTWLDEQGILTTHILVCRVIFKTLGSVLLHWASCRWSTWFVIDWKKEKLEHAPCCSGRKKHFGMLPLIVPVGSWIMHKV